MLRVDNISKIFHGAQQSNITIIQNISFEAKPNEVTVIVGPNGCGKSTLLKIIAKLESPTTGTVLFNNRADCQLMIGMVFQNHYHSLFPWLTVSDNLDFALRTHTKDAKTRQEETSRLLDKLLLTEHKDKYPYQLSGGLSQLTALGRALALEPGIILMDEPFSALDYHTAMKLQAHFLVLREQINIPIIIVTHSLDDAILLSDKIILLSPQPSKIIQTIENKLERPRTPNLLNHDYFHELKKIMVTSLNRNIYANTIS